MFPVVGTTVVPGLAMALIGGSLATVLVLAIAFVVLVLGSAMSEQFRRTAAREWEQRRRAQAARRVSRGRAVAQEREVVG